MKINQLYVKNIGPFKEATLEFPVVEDKKTGEVPVTIITGVNGSGKSIIIDAIRAILSGQEQNRNIVANDNDFQIAISVNYDGEFKTVETHDFSAGHISSFDYLGFARHLQDGYQPHGRVFPWVLDYWSSKLPTDSFALQNMRRIDVNGVLKDVLKGKKSNVDLTNFICQIDYLRTSEMPEEKEVGETLYAKLKEIVNLCLGNGTFKYVRRSDLTPIVVQNGMDLSLEKLSSGNLFLIEHLVLLMCKFYSVAVLNKIHVSEMFNLSGLLLADELENHMHPAWQKRILGIIRRLFPNLQVILTTHSPFVVSSLDGAKIYTCVPRTGYSEVMDETDKYSHMPVEEILQSDVFNVNPFNEEIEKLMSERKALISEGKIEEGKKVAEKLYAINPEYFSYMNPNL